MESLAFIEGISPKGHVKFNRFYLERFKKKAKAIYIGNSLSSSYEDIQGVSYFDDKCFSKGRVCHALFFLINTTCLLIKIKIKRINHVILFSYDDVTLFLVSYVANVLCIKLYTFEHNTVPSKKTTKYFFQKLCIKKIVRLCFTPKAAKIYEEMGRPAKYIPLPAISSNEGEVRIKSNDYNTVVFCPSCSASIEVIKDRVERNPNILFIVKTKEIINFPNVQIKPYFKDYDAILNGCDYVYLPVSFSGRVSGVFFEAIAAKKKVIVSKGDFFDYVKKYFNECVIEDQDDWSLNTLTEHSFNCERYNNEIIDKITEVFERTR